MTLLATVNGNITAGANAQSPVPVNIVKGTHPQLIAFLVLNMWPSHFGLPLLLAIVLFSKRVQRHPTFVNLCVIFIIVGISSSLLLYAGSATGPEPAAPLCLLQASLLYGYPPLSSLSAFVLVLQVFLGLKASYYGGSPPEKNHLVKLWAMLITPYVAFFVTMLATAIIGAANPRDVSRSRRFFYCSVKSDPLSNSVLLFAAVFLTGTVIIEVWIVIILYRQRTTLREISMPIRVLVYGAYITIILSLSLLSVKSPESPAPDLILASAPSLFLLIFGTQKDILYFWRRENMSFREPLVPLAGNKIQSPISGDGQWRRFTIL